MSTLLHSTMSTKLTMCQHYYIVCQQSQQFVNTTYVNKVINMYVNPMSTKSTTMCPHYVNKVNNVSTLHMSTKSTMCQPHVNNVNTMFLTRRQPHVKNVSTRCQHYVTYVSTLRQHNVTQCQQCFTSMSKYK